MILPVAEKLEDNNYFRISGKAQSQGSGKAIQRTIVEITRSKSQL